MSKCITFSYIRQLEKIIKTSLVYQLCPTMFAYKGNEDCVKLVGSPHTISYADELSCRGYSVVGLNKHLWYKFRYTVTLISKSTMYCFDVYHTPTMSKCITFSYYANYANKLTFISDAFLYPVSYRVCWKMLATDYELLTVIYYGMYIQHGLRLMSCKEYIKW